MKDQIQEEKARCSDCNLESKTADLIPVTDSEKVCEHCYLLRFKEQDY